LTSVSWPHTSTLVEVRRRPIRQALMRPLVIVELEVAVDARPRLRHHPVVRKYTSSYFSERHKRSIKILSMHRPRPSMLTAMPRPSNSPVNFSLVNCDPSSLLKISGRPQRNAFSNASTQKGTSIVTDNAQLSTNRLYQSITATRYTNPCAIRMYVMSVLHTWLTRFTSTPSSRYG